MSASSRKLLPAAVLSHPEITGLLEQGKVTGTEMFELKRDDPFVAAFQAAYQSLAGQPLPIGAKPFCDDGNSFWALAGVPAITHGPRAGGAHTLNEWVDIDDLVRVAKVYALTAIHYCADLN